MTIQLPPTIAAYFANDRMGNAAAISENFAPGAVVVDEGNTYTGQDAIRQWMANASTKYSYTSEPFSLTEEGGVITVTSHLTAFMHLEGKCALVTSGSLARRCRQPPGRDPRTWPTRLLVRQT